MPDERMYQTAANADVEVSDDGPHDQGSGEWPDPDAPATGPAPGAGEAPAGPDDEKRGMAAVLNADPVAGGSSSSDAVDAAGTAPASSPTGPAAGRAATPDPYNEGDVANPSADPENAGRGKSTTH